jgi:Holliday junction resolvasome RuvABC endonuclease subunit
VANKRWKVGIDPGFTETGVVLSYEEKDHYWKVVSIATMACPPGKDPIVRATSLSAEVIMWLHDQIEDRGIKVLQVAIETPIYNKNPVTFEKQWRLVQDIQSGLLFVIASMLKSCAVVEVPPTTVKRLATGKGKATKAEMVAASPFEGLDVGQSTKEALADAWAISLAVHREAKLDSLEYVDLKMATVKHIYALEVM